ncbi:MAG TPA: BTAD domain-containing putative transcriptional regulator [Candidatus Eremiobacteraceae bacterium]|nr:BTAD domain-containing putative transcriptional regulator [Candidatus Eremiobacteraceae bacterium]
MATKSVIRWSADTTVDAVRFAALAGRDEAAALQEALQLYRGDFLEGDYDPWAAAERERLTMLYESVLAKMVATTRDPEAARTLIARNPYAEDAYAALIEAELEAGRSASAIDQVDRCRKALAEVGEAPSQAFDDRFGHIAARALDVPRSNLPVQVTSFVARETEVSKVKSLLAKSRLVTITGTGGVGKTRVALRVGADVLNGSGNGVWFADLAKVSSPEYVVSQIATVLDVRAFGNRPLLDQVLSYLRDKRLLLILDNCEHVIAEASRVAIAIIKDCPRVSVLATSREVLNVGGEQVYRLPSLSLPPSEGNLNAAESLQYEAVALFVTRASAADEQFSFGDGKASKVGDICRRLDGIALAIELAAARVRMFSVDHLAQRLDERFDLLSGADRTVLPRQQTMRATIDWSYGLLSAEAKALFRRLSIFQGGWSLDAALTVCADDRVEKPAILETLSSLVDKSLVAVDFGPEQQRYRLLETLREYGVERLNEHGEFAAVAERHAGYFAKFGNLAKERAHSTAMPKWLPSVEAELDNIRAVLEWSLVQKNDPVLGARLAECLWVFWLSRPYHDEGVRWLELALGATSTETDSDLNVAVALALTGMLMTLAMRPEALQAAERAVAAARTLGDDRTLARACYYAGQMLSFENRLDESQAVLEEALALAERVGDRHRVSVTLQELGRLHRKRGELGVAAALLSRAEELQRDNPTQYPWALIERACLEKRSGELSRAIELAREALAAGHAFGEARVQAVAGTALTMYLAVRGDIDPAVESARFVLQETINMRYEFWFPFIAEAIAAVAIRQNRLESAAYLVGWAEQEFGKRAFGRDAFVDAEIGWFLKPLRSLFGEEQLAKLLNIGASWGLDQAIEELRAVLA